MIPGIYLILLIIENYYYDNPLFVMVQPINKFDKELNYHLILFTENKKKKFFLDPFVCFCIVNLVSFLLSPEIQKQQKKKIPTEEKKNCFVGQSIISPLFFFFF